MEELQKMMDEINKEQLHEMLEEMQQNDEDLKGADRSLELFKQMELQQKLEKQFKNWMS